jgi:hypothetical protein
VTRLRRTGWPGIPHHAQLARRTQGPSGGPQVRPIRRRGAPGGATGGGRSTDGGDGDLEMCWSWLHRDRTPSPVVSPPPTTAQTVRNVLRTAPPDAPSTSQPQLTSCFRPRIAPSSDQRSTPYRVGSSPKLGRPAAMSKRPVSGRSSQAGSVDRGRAPTVRAWTLATIPPCEATRTRRKRAWSSTRTPRPTRWPISRCALDLPAAAALTIDGRSRRTHDRLVATGLRIGSAVTDATRRRRRRPLRRRGGTPATCDGLSVAVGVGPACERWITLSPGRHVMGRAASAQTSASTTRPSNCTTA